MTKDPAFEVPFPQSLVQPLVLLLNCVFEIRLAWSWTIRLGGLRADASEGWHHHSRFLLGATLISCRFTLTHSKTNVPLLLEKLNACQTQLLYIADAGHARLRVVDPGITCASQLSPQALLQECVLYPIVDWIERKCRFKLLGAACCWGVEPFQTKDA